MEGDGNCSQAAQGIWESGGRGRHTHTHTHTPSAPTHARPLCAHAHACMHTGRHTCTSLVSGRHTCTSLVSKCSATPARIAATSLGARQGFGGSHYPRHPKGGVRDWVRQVPLGGCSCDTPATPSKLRKEPRRRCSYTLERDKRTRTRRRRRARARARHLRTCTCEQVP